MKRGGVNVLLATSRLKVNKHMDSVFSDCCVVNSKTPCTPFYTRVVINVIVTIKVK